MSRRSDNPVDDAVAFLATPGRAERVLASHHDRGDGQCSGCCVHTATWPCPMARFAQQAIAGRVPQ